MEFVIPKGLDFAFTIKVMDKENKVPQNLDTLTKATLTILNKETQAKMMSIDMTASTTVLGLLECIIPKAKTAMLEIKRAGVEDN
ncbi:MAG: hypothetical protein KAH32_07005, partial [Chlamydiia bacterium]|nr:hypothetical protein [Chlamydiia bacterium]